tara:strand:- start:16062 stop:16346 length:285 start_codon:yes stop_codon:yes gene_type:complete
MVERTTEFWVALVAAAAYVFLNSREKAIHYRIVMVASSAGFGFSLAKDVSDWLGIGETFAGVVIIVFGYMLIDLVTALVSDRAFVKEVIKSRFK